jgi:hypothetical protein
MKSFWKFFVIQIFAYGIVDASYRFIAQANMTLSVITATVYAVLSFTVIRDVATGPQSRGAITGYAAGSAIGTWIGIAVSRAVTGV